MGWLAGPKDEIDQVRRALAKHFDLPKTPDHIGRNCRRVVPTTYSPGAPGWTDEPCMVADDASGAQSAIEVPDALASSLQGQEISVRGVRVRLDFRGATPEPPARFFRPARPGGDPDELPQLRERPVEQRRVRREEYEED